MKKKSKDWKDVFFHVAKNTGSYGYMTWEVHPSSKSLLEELVNTPILKIPFWIEAHKKELKELGIELNEKSE